MGRVLFAFAFAFAACGPRATPPAGPALAPGVTIALYRKGATSYGIVDDRRSIEVAGSTILLGNIDPGAALASLVIESGNPAVRIGPCTRERLPDERDLGKGTVDPQAAANERRLREQRERMMRLRRYRRPAPAVPPPRPRPAASSADKFAPIVQCDVAGPPGTYLVRIVYVSTTLSYRVQHDIELTDPTKATIESRFAVTTPPWRTRAELVLFEGVPGDVDPPREITRGMVTLDGGTSVLFVPTREVAATLRRVFAGADIDDEYDIDTMVTWATLEVPQVRLTPGPIRVHVALSADDDRWIDIPVREADRFAEPADEEGEPAPRAKDPDEPLRIKLWVDPTLRGTRQRLVVENDGVRMVEVIALTITNSSDEPREVYLEERARAAKRRVIDRAWPSRPSAHGDIIRSKVTVKPGRVERVGYTIVYEL